MHTRCCISTSCYGEMRPSRGGAARASACFEPLQLRQRRLTAACLRRTESLPARLQAALWQRCRSTKQIHTGDDRASRRETARGCAHATAGAVLTLRLVCLVD
jgi:hypothetical protein